ncbi:TPA: XRE family transcriptional regulator, partial [Pasteurella multocida]|nr:XRE family transcriptional regulator [Pasteurella multocida]
DIFIRNIPNISNDETINLTKEEESLLDDFRSMNDQGKTAVKTTARAMAEQELFKNSKVG